MTSFADFEPLTSAEGVTFTPWTDGHAVGFRITREQDDRVEIVSLSPSSDHNRPDWEGRGDVFVYHAAAGPGETVEDDVYGSPVCFIDVFEPVDKEAPAARLEYLRTELRAERISQGELIELQNLAEHIDPGDTELLEAAGVPEHPEA